jgi:hypothetical protein
VDAIYAADDGETSLAEICRRVGRVADEFGLARPSYVHVRRLVLTLRDTAAAEARRRAARRRIAEDALVAALLGWRMNVYDVRERLARAADS